jgi:hypothetical protein
MSESGSHNLPDDALVDLLIKQVTEGLSPAEQRELDVLDGAVASEYLRDFERAAAAVALAGTPLSEPPAALRALLEQQAAQHFATPERAVPAPAEALRAAANNVVDFRAPLAETRPASRSGAMGWFAAAACLVLAVVGWMRTPPTSTLPTPDVNVVALPPTVVPPVEVPPPTPPSPAEQRLALLAKQDTIKVTLGATKDAAAKGVTGDVVWDPATQTGYMHFVGLQANDPQVRQYQIWIFDGSRDKRYPVDGGVFDVPADAGEVVIPIRATLSVQLVKAFAVTVEKPGGVVVSGLGHVVALGAAG